ncbi:MAG: hypothetical protein WCG02_04450 [Candidatus Taylorbacteria bacterium]
MELQIRDKRNPFTQALSFLFRNEKDVDALKRKLRKEMIPLVTQVAIKIGGIGTEGAVRNRSLEMFTGMISMHLAQITVGKQGDLISEWADIVKGADLALLFRKGYTVLNEYIPFEDNSVSFGDWVANIRSRSLKGAFFMKVEYLEKHSTNRDKEGFWTGYAHLNHMYILKEQFEYALWLVRQAKAEQNVIEDRTLYMDSETVVSRILINIFLSGRVSMAMDYRRVKRVIDLAHGKKHWLVEAMKRYERFLLTVPESFRSSILTEGRSLHGRQRMFWEMVEGWSTKRLTHDQAIDDLCMYVAINPPGLQQRMFDADRNNLKEHEIE